MDDKYLTVTQLTKYIKYKINNDPNLDSVYLKGEISNFKLHSRGHFYFTLKDENARINAIMFSSSVRDVSFKPEDGMTVLVRGKINVYEATGQYQIYVDEMLEDGLGKLYIAYEQLKKKLAEEGLFDEKFKKPIPKYPQTIGIITAQTGAAIKDILSTIKRRWPIAKTILFPSLVQGSLAADDIVRNIELSKEFDLDVLIVGRGGGSIEDLWSFNEEKVARAIFNLEVPVVSAVGHEIDFTISDFVADLRAPTPTGAAEMVVPSKIEVINYLNQLNIRLIKNMKNYIDTKRLKLNNLMTTNVLKNPYLVYQNKEQQYINLMDRININIQNIIKEKRVKLNNLKDNYLFKNPKNIYILKQEKYHNLVINLINNIEKIINNYKYRFAINLEKLNTLSPLEVLNRGYSISKKKNIIIKSIKEIKIDEELTTELKDGILISKIIKKEEK